ALPTAAEAERLQLADDLEGERVIELGDVDVARAQPGGSEGVAGGGAAGVAGGRIRAPDEIPRRCDLVGGAVRVAGAAEDPDRARGEVDQSVGVGDDKGTATLRRHGAVEEMEGFGDHARGEDVGRREGSTAVVHGV